MRTLKPNTLKSIIARRDPRYDGRFYFGVKTTNIYCRPICPARPKPENIVLFKSASEAERLGYRACLRCRPDLAPGSKILDGTLNTVARALRIIQGSAEQALSVENLAETLGMTDRQVRRLFQEHLGASPIEVMTTQRLHFAKQLLCETNLPITEVCFAAGFQSVRRFNEAFKASYALTPSHYRQDRGSGFAGKIQLKLPIRPPYDWDTVLAYLKRHEAFGIEEVVGDTYRRYIPQGNSYGTAVVSHERRERFLRVDLTDIPVGSMRSVLTRLKDLFDTDHNPSDLPRCEGHEPDGIRVPGSFDAFETAVSIILSQLVTTAHAKTTLKKLIERFGHKITTIYAFPSPDVLADAPIEEIGVTRHKAGAIRGLARAIASGSLDFTLRGAFDTDALLSIKGIGPWTAAMISMRCARNPDAFPEHDLIVRRALEQKIVDHGSWVSLRAYMTHGLWRDYSVSLSKSRRKE